MIQKKARTRPILIDVTRIVFSVDRGIGNEGTALEYKSPILEKSGKEAAADIPSWAKGNRTFKGENERIC